MPMDSGDWRLDSTVGRTTVPLETCFPTFSHNWFRSVVKLFTSFISRFISKKESVIQTVFKMLKLPRNPVFIAVTILLVAVVIGSLRAEAWIASPLARQCALRPPRTEPPQPRSPIRQHKGGDVGGEQEREKGFFERLNPYETNIPPELRDEIYAAEANTPAARERGQRVAMYILIAFVGIMGAFFNGFLTELRGNGPDGSGVDIADAGFGWVVDNPFLSFLFLNKIGGAILLLGGGGAGLLAEAEIDTKRINAEKIFEELERRRLAKNKKARPASSKKKRRGGKEAQRLEALSEVFLEDEKAGVIAEEKTVPQAETMESTLEKEGETSKNEGILGTLKSFYEKADTMAASQALLLNKKLEDVGVVDKITDETGLKVIGKEEAAKLKNEKEQAEN